MARVSRWALRAVRGSGDSRTQGCRASWVTLSADSQRVFGVELAAMKIFSEARIQGLQANPKIVARVVRAGAEDERAFRSILPIYVILDSRHASACTSAARGRQTRLALPLFPPSGGSSTNTLHTQRMRTRMTSIGKRISSTVRATKSVSILSRQRCSAA